MRPEREDRPVIAACLAAALAHLAFMLVSGKGLLDANPYNSYVLQACSWLNGRLDVDNRAWLELAIYGGRYYVSFPPFPSYVLLPFAALFGEAAPDGPLAFFTMLLGVACAVRLARRCSLAPGKAAAMASFLYLANNLWQITVDGWVWFLAQNMAVTLTLLAFVFGAEGKKGGACFCLCAAVGCRPFQIVYFPVVLWLLLRADAGRTGKWKRLLWEKDYRLIPAVLLAVSFLTLNFARFGNPLEFGHSYLPEFTRSPYGQFGLRYLPQNLYSLVRLPEYNAELGRWVFPPYNGGNVFLVFPLFLLCLGVLARALWQRRPQALALPGLVLLHIFLLCLHKTMGGAHFGNRYLCDVTPAAYLGLCLAPRPCRGRKARVAAGLGFGLLFCFGFALNFFGVLDFYGPAGP